jgi:hypothetical protein
MQIMNHNASFREFVYRVELSPEEIWAELDRPEFPAAVRYRVCRGSQTIVFSTELPVGQPDITYGLTFSGQEGCTLLKVTQLDWLWEKNCFAAIQNEFWEKKLGAVPVDYIRYG